MKKAALITKTALCLTFPLSLMGCETLTYSGAALVANDIFNQQPHNFTAQNYAVADYLLQHARSYLNRGSLIKAKPLIDMEAPELTSTLAKLIPEQVGVRLSQLGYTVNLSDVTTVPETAYMNAGEEAGKEPEFILTGHYIRSRPHLEIKSRIIDVKSNRIIASFDYTIDYDARVRELAEPKPLITKL